MSLCSIPEYQSGASAEHKARPIWPQAPAPTYKSQSRPKTPTLFQFDPKKHTTLDLAKRSPTHSIESRHGWAKKEYFLLKQNPNQPTHTAVIKFTNIESPARIKYFNEILRRKAEYLSKTKSPIAGYFTREIEKNNKVHLHFVLFGAVEFFDLLVSKTARSTGIAAELRYLQPIQNLDGCLRYVAKFSNAAPLLFKPGVIRLSGSFGHYWAKPKQELWQEIISDWFPIDPETPPEPPKATGVYTWPKWVSRSILAIKKIIKAAKVKRTARGPP
jgi:hypothetical protein